MVKSNGSYTANMAKLRQAIRLELSLTGKIDVTSSVVRD